MNNYDQLLQATEAEQLDLLAAPIISDVVSGDVDLHMYQAFLTNAYHHVRYTVPLMMATASRIHPSQSQLINVFKEYIDEEFGHEKWILNDLQACGADPELIATSEPNFATEVMLAYIRDYITTVNPLGFLGMVHVLEGTSTSLATSTADLIQQALQLPDQAFSYLRSHGALDIEHVDFFKNVLETLSAADMDHVVHVAKRAYVLYGNVLRSVPRLESQGAAHAA